MTIWILATLAGVALPIVLLSRDLCVVLRDMANDTNRGIYNTQTEDK
jgi:hypothetical protein